MVVFAMAALLMLGQPRIEAGDPKTAIDTGPPARPVYMLDCNTTYQRPCLCKPNPTPTQCFQGETCVPAGQVAQCLKGAPAKKVY